MALGNWQIGLDIQESSAYAVALARRRQGWQLRGWWAFSEPEDKAPSSLWGEPQRLAKLLTGWRQQLPRYFSLAVSFPALQTVQRQLPAPTLGLNEPQCAAYLALNLARELQLDADALRLDYQPVTATPSRYAVTAVQRTVVEPMVHALGQIGLSPAGLTPDACALQALLPAVAAGGYSAIVHSQPNAWLWATPEAWGAWPRNELAGGREVCEALGLPVSKVAFIQTCDDGVGDIFDPWQTIIRRLPPLPEQGWRYGVALALAQGGVP